LFFFSQKGAGWEVEDDDLELPEELASKITATVVKDGNYFTAPTKGVPPQQVWVNNSQLAADHVRSGSFETAFRLLNDQVGIVNFLPLQQLFLNLYSGSRTSVQALPSIQSLFVHPNRNWKETNSKNFTPILGIRINDLVQRLHVSLFSIWLPIVIN
jgi:coatomer subunit alpha